MNNLDLSGPGAAPEPIAQGASRGARVAVLLTAVLVPAWAFFAHGREHLNLADEGYLWYGVLRTLAGEWPLRDFQAYDPGRYHWCVLWSPLVGHGIVGVRAATSIFAALGLAAGLAMLARAGPRASTLAGIVLAGIVLGLWHFPRHKLYEPALALILAWGTARMLAAPTLRRHFAAGCLVGLATWFGRNHAFYGALGGAAALALDRWKDPRPGTVRRAAAWAGGIAAGALPFAATLLLVPGLARGFAYSVRLNLVHGTNLPHPWPWPWDLALEGSGRKDFRAVAEVAAFLLPVVAVPALAWTVARTRRTEWRARAPLVAATILGTIYMHHAMVRSDMAHLAQSLAPLLVAAFLAPLCLGANRARTACVWGTVALLSLAVSVSRDPDLARSGAALVEHRVAGERLELSLPQSAYLTALERTMERNVGAAPLFIAPNRATLYCVLGKRAPTWWIYHFWKVPPAEQDATIASLREQGFDWALIVDAPMDDRADLLFRSTNDRVWAHFEREWERVPTPGLPADHILLHRIQQHRR